MMDWTSPLQSIRSAGLYRRLEKAGDGLLDFSSNDYLGLSRDGHVRAALVEALLSGISLGATGSRLLRGQYETHERVEDFLAEWFACDSALLFPSGYSANLAMLSALADNESEIFSDELNHASLVDGIRLSKAKRGIFSHNDVEDLRRKLIASQAKRKFIVTESVFSMDGDLAPLLEFLNLAREFGAALIVDEAHATGVFGAGGRGRLAELDTSDVCVMAVHTCGKALGAQGAFVLSNLPVREMLINRARSFIFSTGISPLLAVQIEAAVRRSAEMNLERKSLLKSAGEFRRGLAQFGNVGRSESQIVPVILGSNENTVAIAERVREEGFDVRAIRSPTVPIGTERLGISLKTYHQRDDLKNLLAVLQKAVQG